MPKLQSVVRTPNEPKKFKAVFVLDGGKTKVVRFGTSSNYVSNPQKTKEHRANYIKRHRVNESFSSPMTAGSLSRHLLWGESRSLRTNVAAFKRKFNL